MIEALIPAMALMSRWRGHASRYKKYFPRPFPQLALSLPFAYAVYEINGNYTLTAIILLLTWAAWSTGWGNVYDLGHAKRGDKLEKIEYPIHWLYGKIPEYWYDFIGLALRGMIITIPAGAAVINPWLAVSGALMAVAYAIGWAVHDLAIHYDKMVRRVANETQTYMAISFMPRHLDGATEIGEFIFGLLMGVVLVIIL